jgi:chromosome segregation ATPase
MKSYEKSYEDLIKEAINRIDSKIERIDERLGAIDRTLLANTASLDKHILRTELAERRLEKLEEELVPVSRHVSQVSGALKFLGILSLVTGFVYSVIKIVGEFVN